MKAIPWTIPFAGALVLTFALTAGSAALVSPDAAEAPFLAENDAAMAKMMNEMTVQPTGDVDRDFVAMMVPHHQGAIDMAVGGLPPCPPQGPPRPAPRKKLPPPPRSAPRRPPLRPAPAPARSPPIPPP